MRTAALVIVASSFSAAAVLFACSKAGEDDSGGAKDAAAETALIGETGAPDLDSGVPLGDPCGDVSGLQPNAPWPMMGGCPKRSGYAGREGAQNAAARFVTPTPAAASSPAVSAEGYLWVGTTSGDVVALSAFYGSMLVSVHVAAGSDPVSSSPALDKDGRAVVGSTDGHVYILDVGGAPPPVDAGDDADASDAEAGVRPAHVAATYDVGGPVVSGPVITHEGIIVVATTNGKVVAVNADGSVAWSVTTGGSGKASPAIGRDGAIVTAGGDGALYALAAADGARKWSYAASADVAGIAVGGDDTVYAGAVDGKVHAVSPDGMPKWTFTAGGPITGAPAVAAALLYVSSADKKLYALDSQTGTKKWEFATLGAAAGPVVSNAGVAYFGSADGKLYAVNPSGLLFFAANVKGAVRAPPAVGYDGTMIVTTEKGITAIGP